MQSELQKSKNIVGAFSQFTLLEVKEAKYLNTILCAIETYVLNCSLLPFTLFGTRTRQGRNRSVVESWSLKENRIKIRRGIENEFLKYIFNKNFSFVFNTKVIQHNLHTTVVFSFKSRSIQVMVIFGYLVTNQRRESHSIRLKNRGSKSDKLDNCTTIPNN